MNFKQTKLIPDRCMSEYIFYGDACPCLLQAQYFNCSEVFVRFPQVQLRIVMLFEGYVLLPFFS